MQRRGEERYRMVCGLTVRAGATNLAARVCRCRLLVLPALTLPQPWQAPGAA